MSKCLKLQSFVYMPPLMMARSANQKINKLSDHCPFQRNIRSYLKLHLHMYINDSSVLICDRCVLSAGINNKCPQSMYNGHILNYLFKA